MTPQKMLDEWHKQQTAFIELRDLRTRFLVDIVEYHRQRLGRPLTIVDVGCGPGSLGTAILERVPDSRVYGLDRDPLLLRLGRETNKHGENFTFLDVDITSEDLAEQLPVQQIDVTVSATALHWLMPQDLVQLYQAVGKLTVDGGLFMNADHLDYDGHTQTFLDEYSQQYKTTHLKDSHAKGAMSWQAWWEEMKALPGWEKERDEWEKRWEGKKTAPHVSEDFHFEALRAAGFGQTGTVYQWLEDRLILAVK